MPFHAGASPPDPFPELSRHRMLLYHFHNDDRADYRTGTSPVTSEMGRRSPGAVPNTWHSDVSVTETSTVDNVTQVVDYFPSFQCSDTVGWATGRASGL